MQYLQMVHRKPEGPISKTGKSQLESNDEAPTGQAQEEVPGQEVAESILTRTGVVTTECVREQGQISWGASENSRKNLVR